MARALLVAACQALAAAELTVAEAYPRTGVLDAASSVPRPIDLYFAEGIAVFREFDAWSVLCQAL